MKVLVSRRLFLARMCLPFSRLRNQLSCPTTRWPIVAVALIALVYLTSLHQTRRVTTFPDQPISKTAPSQQMKIVLFWTTYFHWKDFEFGMGREPFVRAGCRVTNCVTTDDRSFLNVSDALLFHPINYDPVNDAPPHRNPRQRYVFLFYEAEASGRIYPVFQHSATHRGFFNWTMTYRRDSDVYSPQPYGILRRRNTSTDSGNTLPVRLAPGMSPPDPAAFLEAIIDNKTKQGTSEQQHRSPSNKTKKIAWFVSKCRTQSRRENFFGDLFQFYPSIDVYGECGSKGLDCQPWKSPECDRIIADYKYYIAAENSLCPDYVTEKFYRPLQAGAVPIVYGGADYSAYAPPYSFIHAADFQSPQALAEYLILLDRNPNLYARYFEWHKDWTVDRQPLDGWCSLCEKLNDPEASQTRQSYQDIGKWWFDDAPCLPQSSLNHQSSHN